jgi:hypothetical protein
MINIKPQAAAERGESTFGCLSTRPWDHVTSRKWYTSSRQFKIEGNSFFCLQCGVHVMLSENSVYAWPTMLRCFLKKWSQKQFIDFSDGSSQINFLGFWWRRWDRNWNPLSFGLRLVTQPIYLWRFVRQSIANQLL